MFAVKYVKSIVEGVVVNEESDDQPSVTGREKRKRILHNVHYFISKEVFRDFSYRNVHYAGFAVKTSMANQPYVLAEDKFILEERKLRPARFLRTIILM